MAEQQRICKCGESVDKHEEKATKGTKASSWRGKSLTPGSTCKRYKWNRQTETAAVTESEPVESAVPAAA